jgi:hypothetical protein
MSNEIFVTVEDESSLIASSNLTNPVTLESLNNVGDVDMNTNGKNNGSILIYKANTSKWTATTTLDAQNMEGGEF